MILLVLLVVVYSFGSTCISEKELPKRDTSFASIHKMTNDPVKIAFFGDSGADLEAKQVLTMIKEWGVDAIVHLGDFDYDDKPVKFENVISQTVPDIPYLAVIGNHDLPKWNEYQQMLPKYLNGVQCNGEYGVKMSCNVKGVEIVLSGVGTFGTDHEVYLDHSLRDSTAQWKICGWHKNQRKFQLGTKVDEVGYAAYEICRQHGAIIMTGHEHSYARSKVMKNFENQIIASNDTNTLTIHPGHTFAIVSGLGGRSIREWSDNAQLNPWWAAMLAKNNNAQNGAVLCEFGQIEANCVFKDTDNNIRDEFKILNSQIDMKRQYKICKRQMDIVAHKNQIDYTRGVELDLEFDLVGIPITKLADVRLQLYFLNSEAKDTLTTITLSNDKHLIHYEEDIETGEVWNSRNIQNLISKELLQLKLTLNHKFVFGEDDCFSPSLMIVVDECH